MIKKALLISLCSFGAFIGITSAIGAGKFNRNTYLNNQDISGWKVSDVQDKFINNRKMTVNGEEIDLSEVDYKGEADLKAPFPSIFASGDKIELKTSYNKAKLDKLIEAKFTETPENAQIVFNGEMFEIMSEKSAYNPEKAYTLIVEGIKSAKLSVDFPKDEPRIKTEDLKEECDRLNKIATHTLQIDFDGKTEERKVGDFLKADGEVDEKAVRQYLNQMTKKYNTLESKRKFKTTGKGEIEVGGSGIDTLGYKLNVEETIPAIKEAIFNQKPVEVVWEEKGDLGNTYVEIDISRQHMWYYINGELFIDTDVRTGTESSAQWTPTTEGAFKVLWKQTDKWFLQVGEPCHSDYWMPFNHRGEGIHDATWYSSYGGNYYKWAGSHGCINTPYNVVQKMYEKMEEGTPVIVYRS